MCYNIYMQQQQYEAPLHADKHRSAFNFTLALSVAVAVVGLFTGSPLLVVVGLVVAAFTWLTTPAQYMIFQDRLVISYGRPRIKHIFFQQVEGAELIKFAIGNRVRIHMRSARPLFIQPRDAEEFESRFQNALDSFRRDNPEGLQSQEG